MCDDSDSGQCMQGWITLSKGVAALLPLTAICTRQLRLNINGQPTYYESARTGKGEGGEGKHVGNSGHSMFCCHLQRSSRTGQLAQSEERIFSHQPSILPTSAARPRRGAAELSTGDALRQSLTRVRPLVSPLPNMHLRMPCCMRLFLTATHRRRTHAADHTSSLAASECTALLDCGMHAAICAAAEASLPGLLGFIAVYIPWSMLVVEAARHCFASSNICGYILLMSAPSTLDPVDIV